MASPRDPRSPPRYPLDRRSSGSPGGSSPLLSSCPAPHSPVPIGRAASPRWRRRSTSPRRSARRCSGTAWRTRTSSAARAGWGRPRWRACWPWRSTARSRAAEGEPCGECDSCQRIWAGRTSLDVVEIDAASNRGVDDARDLRERAMYAPSEHDRFKVYIIDEAHMLTREAWNALLKILEEPPPRVIFVFATTEPQKIQQAAPPILSRCQRFDFHRIGTARPGAPHARRCCAPRGSRPPTRSSCPSRRRPTAGCATRSRCSTRCSPSPRAPPPPTTSTASSAWWATSCTWS